MINEKDILRVACGRDKLGITKSMVKIETSIISMDGKDPINIDDMVLDNPAINIFKSMAFTMIDLTFDSSEDYELAQLFSMLTNFCKPENGIGERFNEVPAVCVTVCPKELDGQYYICGLHAMWSVMSSKGSNVNDTIRFIVSNEYLHTYQFNTDLIDTEAMEEEALAEMENGIL